MSERRALRALLLVAALAACGDDDAGGPVGAPGGFAGIQLRYLTPRLRVLPAGGPAEVEIALEVVRSADGGEPAPWAGARLRVERLRGRASAATARVETDAGGRARVAIDAGPEPDRATFSIAVEDEPRAHLPFDVVVAEVVPVPIAPGQVVEVDAPRASALLRIDVPPGTALVLVPYQVDRHRTGSTYRFTWQGVDPPPDALAAGAETPTLTPSRPAVGLDDRGHLVESSDPGGLGPASATLPGWVDIQSCRVPVSRDAPLRYLGRAIALYVDGAPGFNQGRIDSLGRAFDDAVAPRNEALFGETTDLDENGVVIAVLTPELREVGGVYCDGLRAARSEIFYASWDPAAPIDRPLSILAHEHQHVINSGAHNSSNRVGDERWLNEALSFGAEARNGPGWASVLARAWTFLNGQNGGVPMLSFTYDRGFDDELMMFATWLGDRFGEGVYRRLSAGNRVGIANVEAATGQPFETVARDWLVASATPGGLDDPRYAWRTIDPRGMEAEIAACACLPVARFEGMRSERLVADFPFDVFRQLNGIDADYYRLEVPDDAPAGPIDVWFDPQGRASVKLAIARPR